MRLNMFYHVMLRILIIFYSHAIILQLSSACTCLLFFSVALYFMFNFIIRIPLNKYFYVPFFYQLRFQLNFYSVFRKMYFDTISSSTQTLSGYVWFCLSRFHILEAPFFRCCFLHCLNTVFVLFPQTTNLIYGLTTVLRWNKVLYYFHLRFRIWWYWNVKNKYILTRKNFPLTGNLALNKNTFLYHIRWIRPLA